VSCWLRTFGDEEWTWRQERCDLTTLLMECTVATPSIVRKAAVLDVGGFDERMPDQGYEDWDLWISLVERGYRGTILPEVLFYYRRRGASVSRRCEEPEVHLRLIRYLVEKHRDSYQRHSFELVMAKDAECAEVLKTNYALQRRLDDLRRVVELRDGRPGAFAAKTRRLTRARDGPGVSTSSSRKLSAIFGGPGPRRERGELLRHVADLEAALAAARAAIGAEPASGSSKLSASLRTLYDRLLGPGRTPSGVAGDGHRRGHPLLQPRALHRGGGGERKAAESRRCRNRGRRRRLVRRLHEAGAGHDGGDGVRVLRTENRGAAAARNHGVRLTSAPFLVMLDADDVLEPNYLDATARRLEDDPALGFVSTAYQAFGEESTYGPRRPASSSRHSQRDLPTSPACSAARFGKRSEGSTRRCARRRIWTSGSLRWRAGFAVRCCRNRYCESACDGARNITPTRRTAATRMPGERSCESIARRSRRSGRSCCSPRKRFY